MHVEDISLIVKLNLKLQCKSQIYVIIVMHTYLPKVLYQSQQLQTKSQIISIKK